MLTSGMTKPRRDHLFSVLNFALQLKEELKNFKDPKGNFIKLRIGISTGGSVCSGVVGNKKFLYDIWGDSVNVASRMQTMCEPGKIHCTESVKEDAESSFTFVERGSIDVKGKGLLKSYYCTGKLFDSSKSTQKKI